jgi:hypothetical protein
MQQKGQGFSIIPTRCPKFLAACATVGIELQKGSPGVSNCYSLEKKYEQGEPGELSYHLSDGGINPLAIAKVWLAPDSDMAEAAALPSRLIACKTPDEWGSIADDLEVLHLLAGVCHMRMFSERKFAVDTLTVSDNEERAAQYLSGLSAAMKREKRRNGAAIAAKLSEAWQPAMFAWVKAWIFNYRELRDIWQSARPSIKIDRGDDFPLVIPKGKDFARLMKRWN